MEQSKEVLQLRLCLAIMMIGYLSSEMAQMQQDEVVSAYLTIDDKVSG